MKKNRKECISGKVRFRDHEQAVDALHRSANRRHFADQDGRQTRRQEIRSYNCKFCKGHHLTSQELWGLAA
jgi:hypothetical protein